MNDTYCPIPNVFHRNDAGKLEGWTPITKEAGAVSIWQAHELIKGDQASIEFEVRQEADEYIVEVNAFGRRAKTQVSAASVHVLEGILADEDAALYVARQAYEHGVTRVTLFGKLVGPNNTKLGRLRDQLLSMWGHYGVDRSPAANHYALEYREFVLEDVLADGKWWLQQSVVDEYAEALFLRRPAQLVEGEDIAEIIDEAMTCGFESELRKDMLADGIVLRPVHELRTQNGDRLILKLTDKDAQDLLSQKDFEQTEAALDSLSVEEFAALVTSSEPAVGPAEDPEEGEIPFDNPNCFVNIPGCNCRKQWREDNGFADEEGLAA
jgi:hypothetical protein